MPFDNALEPRDHFIDDLVSPPLPPRGWLSHHGRQEEPIGYAIPAALLAAAGVLAVCLLAIAY